MLLTTLCNIRLALELKRIMSIKNVDNEILKLVTMNKDNSEILNTYFLTASLRKNN